MSKYIVIAGLVSFGIKDTVADRIIIGGLAYQPQADDICRLLNGEAERPVSVIVSVQSGVVEFSADESRLDLVFIEYDVNVCEVHGVDSHDCQDVCEFMSDDDRYAAVPEHFKQLPDFQPDRY